MSRAFIILDYGNYLEYAVKYFFLPTIFTNIVYARYTSRSKYLQYLTMLIFISKNVLID